MADGMIEMRKEDFKEQLLGMHRRGYREGCEDVIKNVITSLRRIKDINGTNEFSISETIQFLESIKIGQYNH